MGQNKKVLIMKAKCDFPDIENPKAYTDTINTLEGACWKEAMDYEITKLEEMNTLMRLRPQTYHVTPRSYWGCRSTL